MRGALSDDLGCQTGTGFGLEVVSDSPSPRQTWEPE